MARYRTPTRDKVLERANASKNRSGGSTSVKMPEEFKDVGFFKVTKEIHNLDVIGYIITDPKHPENIEPGYLWHSRRYFSHRNVGAEENSYVCVARTFGRKCPICDAAKAGKNSGSMSKEELDHLRPRERTLMCVIDRDDKDAKIQLLDMSYHLFGKMLDKEVTDSDDAEVFRFFEPDGGITLRCRFQKKSFNKSEFWECDRIDFKDRKKDYPEAILEEVPPLDDILIALPYEQLEQIYVLGDAGSNEDTPRRKRERENNDDNDTEERKPRRGRDPEPEEEEQERPRRGRERNSEPEQEPEEERPRRSRKEQEPEEEPAPRRPSRREKDPEPEEEEKLRRPARGGRGRDEEPEQEEKPRRPTRKEPEPEQEPEEEPAPRRPSRSASKDDDGGKCPQGFTFGDDCEKDDACDSCKVWGACNAAKQKRK